MNDKSILITGGTGSFGTAFTKKLLNSSGVRRIVIYSRDEMKQWYMQKAIGDDPRIRFFIGDVRDKTRLHRAFENVDIVVHAAATKIVPTAERDPLECIKTNILGSSNVVDIALDHKLERVVSLSTDKASSPINLYGATKLVSDKLMTAANAYSSYPGGTKFSVVRYGNVVGSRGSVVPFFMNCKEEALPITDPNMTRFMISMDQATDLVLDTIRHAKGGEMFIKKIPSMKITDIAAAVRPKSEFKIVGVRPGEKIHEQMISSEEARDTYDLGDTYAIVQQMSQSRKFYDDTFPKVRAGFEYNSATNEDWMSVEDLQNFISRNRDQFLEVKPS